MNLRGVAIVSVLALAGVGGSLRPAARLLDAITAQGDAGAARSEPVSRGALVAADDPAPAPGPDPAASGLRAQPSPAAGSADSADGVDRPPEEDRAEQDEAAQVASILSRLQQFLDRDPLDSAWARETERAIERAILAGYPDHGSRLIAARCRAHLCRLELAHRSPAASEAFLRDFGRMEAFRDVQAFYAAVPGTGDLRTLIYVSRAGGRLPPLD